MKETLKQLGEVATNNPKTQSLVVVFMVWLQSWWVDYGDWLVDMLTKFFGLIILILIAVKHYLEIRKDLTEDEK